MRNTLVHPWKIHPHTGEPLTAVGVRRDGRPIWPIMGASEDDDPEGGGDDDPDDDPEGGGDDDPDDDDDDSGADPDAGKSPDELKAELRALRSSKAKLLREAKNRAKGGNGRSGGGKDGDDGKGGKNDKTFTRDDVDDLVEETKASERQALMPAIIRSQSRTILSGLGVEFSKKPEEAKGQLARLLRLADTEELELNDDGEVDGLEHAFRQVKRDFPQLFKGRARVPNPGNSGGGGRPSNKKLSATEQQLRHAFGKSDDD